MIAAILVIMGVPRMAAGACLLCTCLTSATGVSFGSYDALSPANTDSAGYVGVTCVTVNLTAVATAYTIALSAGSSGSFASRHLNFGGNRLDYNLYTDSSRTTVWGDGTGSSSVVSDSYMLSPGLGENRTYTAYARLPAHQNVPIGVYLDLVVVTVTY